jgi:hypothetical protein
MNLALLVARGYLVSARPGVPAARTLCGEMDSAGRLAR